MFGTLLLDAGERGFFDIEVKLIVLNPGAAVKLGRL